MAWMERLHVRLALAGVVSRDGDTEAGQVAGHVGHANLGNASRPTEGQGTVLVEGHGKGQGQPRGAARLIGRVQVHQDGFQVIAFEYGDGAVASHSQRFRWTRR